MWISTKLRDFSVFSESHYITSVRQNYFGYFKVRSWSSLLAPGTPQTSLKSAKFNPKPAILPILVILLLHLLPLSKPDLTSRLSQVAASDIKFMLLKELLPQ